MRIESIGAAGSYSNVRSLRTLARIDEGGRKVTGVSNPIGRIAAADPVEPAITPPASGPAPQEAHAPGVIRLLEAGHFRGVADVRLRIVFFDQLAARAQESARTTLADGSRQLVDSVSTAVDELIAPLAESAESAATLTQTIEHFASGVESAVEEALSTGAIDKQALETALRSAFDDLVEQLRTQFAPPPEDAPAPSDSAAGEADAAAVEIPIAIDRRTAIESAVAADGRALEVSPILPDAPSTDPIDEAAPPTTPETQEPISPLEESMAALTIAFNEALATLLDSLQQVLRLPDPNPAKGRGSTYSKFLAMYNELRGVSSSVDAVA